MRSWVVWLLLAAACADCKWLQGPPAETHVKHTFTLALRQRNLQKLEQIFWEVSDPHHDRYGDYLDNDQIRDLVAPPEEHQNAVLTHLRTAGATEVSLTTTGDMIRCVMTTEQAAAYFGAKLHWFQHAVDKKAPKVARPAGWPATCTHRVPSAIASYVELVPEMCSHPMMRVVTSIKHVPQNQNDGRLKSDPFDPPFTPSQLRKLYNTPEPASWKGNWTRGMGMSIMTQQNYCPADLLKFLSKYMPSETHLAIPEHQNWTNVDTNCEAEASVDTQYTMGMGPNVYPVLWGFRDWIDLAWGFFNQSVATTPKVWSMSYHQNNEYLIPDKSEYERMNVEYQKVAAAGGTLIFSSADHGVGCNPNNSTFAPMLPQSSPYITTIGSTMTTYKGVRTVDVDSGGGFSTIFERPSYQNELVSNYLNRKAGQLNPPSNLFNANGRAYPDFAGEGWEIYMVMKTYTVATSGTSVTAPQIAGLLALLNQKRAEAGKPVLGFVNPLFYTIKSSYPDTFNDTMTGRSSFPYKSGGCTPPANWTEGFEAAPGWNPVTGLGQPNMARIAEVINAFPKKFRAH